VTIEGPRVLDRLMPGSSVTMVSEVINTATNNWDIVTALPGIIVQRAYFDLSGYQLEDLTAFFQGIDMQEGSFLSGDDDFSMLTELITTEFVSDAEITAVAPTFNDGMAIGFGRSTFNQEQIVYGRSRLYTIQSNIVVPSALAVTRWGTCAGATVDKLHITRIFRTGQAAGASTVEIPDVNVVVAIIVAKEKELPFLMRQKRSYELATGP